MGRYSNPAATKAASLMQVPPSGPGNRCEPALSFQLRIWSNPSIMALRHVPLSWNVHAAGSHVSTLMRSLAVRRWGRPVRERSLHLWPAGLALSHGALEAASGSVEGHARPSEARTEQRQATERNGQARSRPNAP